MVPREAERGQSFKGAGAYYLHDKNEATSERVEFTHTENIPTQDPDKALKWMAWTAIHADELKREAGVKATGRPCTKPVFTLSLSWHPEQKPKKWEMIGAGRRALIALGLEDHETLMVSHTDRPHSHLHLIVNVIHPETGKVNNLPYSRKKLSEWAESYERAHGKIYCETRVENDARRNEGEYVKHQEPELDVKTRITALYQRSDNGAAFRSGLEELGFTLAQGKRLVLIDRNGKIHSLSRQIEGVKAKDIRKKLGDLELPDVDTVRSALKPDRQPRETETEAAPTQKPQIVEPPPRREPSPSEINRMQARHLAELGAFYTATNHARLSLAAKLDRQYGADEGKLRHDIAHLESDLTNSTRLRVWWLKVTKKIPKTAEQDLRNLKLTLENIEWRKAEAERAQRIQEEQRRFAIEERHHRERLELSPQEPEDQHFENEYGDEPEIDDFGPTLDF